MPPEKIALAVVQQMLGRDGRADSRPGIDHEFNRARRRDVLEHHAQAGEPFEQRLQHRIDEVSFSIEHIHFGLRRLAVHQQGHADLFHARENPVHLGNAGYAGIGVGRRAGRIQLDTVDEPAGPRTIDLPRRRGIRQVQRQQRLEARAGRQRRQDSFAICARRGRRVDRRLKIGHRDGPPEPLRGKLHHRGERRAVAKMHVPIVGRRSFRVFICARPPPGAPRRARGPAASHGAPNRECSARRSR